MSNREYDKPISIFGEDVFLVVHVNRVNRMRRHIIFTKQNFSIAVKSISNASHEISVYCNKTSLMGNKISIATSNVFQEDLKKVNELINNLLNEDNTFRNSDYNFLSKDVCEKHTLVLENELSKHLKVSLNELGSGMFLIPNNDNSETKKKICKKISSHYMRILYLLTLIKYVYDLEHHGDYSVAGIIFRNLKTEDDILSVKYCGMPQRDYTTQDKRINFQQLEGLAFFVEYVLDKKEAKAFLSTWKAILARKSKTIIKRELSTLFNGTVVDKPLLSSLQNVYKSRYNEALLLGGSSPDFLVDIAKDNPVFLKDYCYDVKQIVIQLGTNSSKDVEQSLATMKTNYNKNIKKVESLLSLLVHIKQRQPPQFELRDITKTELDDIANQIKGTITAFYIQSLLDYQNLLDIAKSNHSIQLNE